MLRRPWTLAQFAAALVLLTLSLIGIIGTVALDDAGLTFTFQGAIQAFAIFPGLVISLVVNALVMGVRRAPAVRGVQLGLLVVELALIAVLVVFHFWDDGSGAGLGFAILLWPIVILLAVAIVVVAAVRLARAPAPPTPAR